MINRETVGEYRKMFYSSVISQRIFVKVIGRKVKLVEAESDAYKM